MTEIFRVQGILGSKNWAVCFEFFLHVPPVRHGAPARGMSVAVLLAFLLVPSLVLGKVVSNPNVAAVIRRVRCHSVTQVHSRRRASDTDDSTSSALRAAQRAPSLAVHRLAQCPLPVVRTFCVHDCSLDHVPQGAPQIWSRSI